MSFPEERANEVAHLARVAFLNQRIAGMTETRASASEQEVVRTREEADESTKAFWKAFYDLMGDIS